MKYVKENPGLALAITAVVSILLYNWYVKMQAKKKAAAAAAATVPPPVVG
jgi:hypothetical protein